ncbi:GntR family transcriptional regulator [Prauserella halophila]|uniref:GntR family transcriptional regulator n=1 Tax=Prauserella halophila TaxID=185641 RepID=UPI0020A29A8B|nr:GntR family transcriptional regulator [Prauserella halophila]MCP2234231.1 GntR family transcriptional regulator [Prauserella halophila]
MSINEASGVGAFHQVAATLRDEIARGKIRQGERIPSARELATQHGVALTTAVRAVDELRHEGVIETQRGRGSFVRERTELFRRADQRYHRNPAGLAPNRAESAAGGWLDHVEAEVWRENADTDIAERLGVPEGDPVSVVRYTWSVDSHPVQISTQWEPLAITAGTPIEEPVDGTRGNKGVIARFDSIGLHIDHVDETTRTRMPSSDESQRLSIRGGIPVFSIERTHWAGETAVETANIIIRGDRMALVARHDVPKEDQ